MQIPKTDEELIPHLPLLPYPSYALNSTKQRFFSGSSDSPRPHPQVVLPSAPACLRAAPVPERRLARRRWNSLRSRGLAASMFEPAVFWRASFDAARGEQLRVPADETLKRRDRELPVSRI